MKYLCNVDDIEEAGSRGFDIDGSALFVVKKRGEIRAYWNRCPHVGVRLEWLEHRFLDFDKELIQCSAHGALFKIDDGFCVSGPCSGQSLKPINLHLEEGKVFADLT